jgi:hypothetical protein
MVSDFAIVAVRLTPYAEGRRFKRKIPIDRVLEVVNRPGQVSVERGRKVGQSRFARTNGREYLLRVIFEEHGSDVIVVSLYETSKVAKYWRQ